MTIPDVWTLTTWLDGDDAEGFSYNYPSYDSALRNGQMFQTGAFIEGDKKPRGWEVRAPDRGVVIYWAADGVCPECKVGDVENIYYEADTGHQQAGCSDGCGWST